MRMPCRSASLLFAVLTALLLSACGFHLRGSSGGSSLPFKTIYVGLPDNSVLGAQLRRYIRAGGEATVVDDPNVAEASIQSLGETRDRVIVSRNTQGQIREYTLLYKFLFRVTDNKKRELLGPTEITLKRQLTYNETQALGKEKEAELLYNDMQSDLVQQIIRRLAAIRPLPASPENAPQQPSVLP